MGTDRIIAYTDARNIACKRYVYRMTKLAVCWVVVTLPTPIQHHQLNEAEILCCAGRHHERAPDGTAPRAVARSQATQLELTHHHRLHRQVPNC